MPDSDRTFVLRVRITLYSNRTQNDTFNMAILRENRRFVCACNNIDYNHSTSLDLVISLAKLSG
jgi:hypothetical protein